MTYDLFDINLIEKQIVEVIFKDKVFLNTYITDQIEDGIQKLTPNQKVYQLVIAKGPYAVDPEMRNAVVHGEAGVKQMAIAWVSPDKEANRVQEEIVSKLPLPYPIRFFDDRESALVWLRSLAAAMV